MTRTPPQLKATLCLFGVLAAAAHGVSAGEPKRTGLTHALSVTVESGFWRRQMGDVVVETIPPELSVRGRQDGQSIEAGSVRVVPAGGAKAIPFRASFRADGSPEKLALQLPRSLPPLSTAQFTFHFRWSTKAGDGRYETAAPGVTFAWPDTSCQLMRNRNGGFELGDAKNSDGWSVYSGEVSTDNPHGGRRCIKLSRETAEGRIPMLILKPFPISPNSRYTLKLRARGVKEGKEGTLIAASFYFLDANKRTVKARPFRAHFGRRDLTDTWTLISADATAPPETRHGQVRIQIYRARGTLFVDDVEVTRPVSAQIAPAMVRFGRIAETNRK